MSKPTKRPRAKVLPIPETVWSQLGPIPVCLTSPVHLEDGNARSPQLMGKYEANHRRIVVDSEMSHLAQLQCAYHEAVHAWLLDAGLRLGKLEEPVVDVIATALVNVLQERR